MKIIACLLLMVPPGVGTPLAAQLPDPTAPAGRPDSAALAYQVFLVGNTGWGTSDELATTLEVLALRLETAGEDAAVVFLGDLVPCCGLPEVGAPGRRTAEDRLLHQIEVVRDFPGRVLFIPGEQDWGRSGDDGRVGWNALLRMEEFIETTLDRGNVFRPDQGFPGPEEINLTREIRLVALNTHWFLTPEERATGDTGEFDAVEDGDVYVELEDLLHKRSNRDMLIVGHHPVLSNGSYGGSYPPKGHLFPLTMVWDWAYLPLPVVGTMAMGARRNAGDQQHFSNMQNRWMRESLNTALTVHEDFVYASAHDFSLQHFWSRLVNRTQHYVVSGSAGKTEWASDADRALMASDERGFMALNYYDNGSIWVDGWRVGDGVGGEAFYEAVIRGPKELQADEAPETIAAADLDYSDSTIVMPAEPGYEAGWLQRFFLGSNLREVWTTPVEVPYFDIGRERGGLVPLKRGGGNQSISVRLEAPDEKQYVLRSVNKDGRRILPVEIQYTFVAPISQDFLSYSNPYGALIIPALSDAVGVFHTNPKLVYVPDDPRLGGYRDLIGDMLMMFEERPNDDMSDEASFGYSDEVIGSFEMKRNLTRDQDFIVDARSYLRARLFDNWLSDWDRHKDQWRWAGFEPPDEVGKIYRPIPRDRDQALNKLNFLGHRIARPFIRFQSFDNKYYTVRGLNYSARKLDHRFLSSLDRDDWRSIADSVQMALTDAVVEDAFRQLPDPIFALHGEEMIETGKIRRDNLLAVADRLYRYHARTADVLGSNKHERFQVARLDNGDTEVVMYKITSDGQRREEIYRRVFDPEETEEIGLYGLGGNDQFVVTGTGPSQMEIHAMGGPGIDQFIDSTADGSGVVFHDSKGENNLQPGARTRVRLSDDPERNDYTEFFEFPRTYPLVLAYYTSDDGVVVGGGVADINHRFRKTPYGNRQALSGSFASSTNALKFNYNGLFKQTYGWWDQGVELSFRNDDNFRNFYTLGNETDGDAQVDTVRIHAGGWEIDLPVQRDFEMGASVAIAPFAYSFDVNDDETQVLDTSQPGLSAPTLETQWYAGVRANADILFQDDLNNPRHGFGWLSALDLNFGVAKAPDDFTTIQSSVVAYLSTHTRRQVTTAFRIGGAHNFGTFPFYGANTIGGQESVRGYRKDRFSGRSSVYGNAELRLELLRAGGVLLPGAVGLTGFFDVGRVWTDGETSSVWHTGYGGGIWYDFAGELLLRLDFGFSDEDTTVSFGPGFFF